MALQLRAHLLNTLAELSVVKAQLSVVLCQCLPATAVGYTEYEELRSLYKNASTMYLEATIRGLSLLVTNSL
jgi:hypothetical protein